MIGLFCIVLAVGAASATDRPFAGVDPNTLSCETAGETHLLLPHHEDCRLFYQCVWGREVLMSGCSAPLIFDFEAQVCNWVWDAKCILRTRTEENEVDEVDDVDGSGSGSGDFDETEFGLMTEEFETSESRHERVTREIKEAFAPKLDCSQPESAARHVAYRGDCQRFWRCVSGAPQTFYCNDGLFFNEATQMCDFEANVRCVENVQEELEKEFIVYK